MRDGPQARAIRAETEVTRREQLARLAYPNPVRDLQPGRRGLHGVPAGRAIAAAVRHARRAVTRRRRGHRRRGSRAGRCGCGCCAPTRPRPSPGWSRNRRASSWLRAHVREVERLIEILRTREREGEGSRFDRLRAEQELRDARQLVAVGGRGAVAEARAAVSSMLPAATPLGRRRRRRRVPQQPAVAARRRC